MESCAFPLPPGLLSLLHSPQLLCHQALSIPPPHCGASAHHSSCHCSAQSHAHLLPWTSLLTSPWFPLAPSTLHSAPTGTEVFPGGQIRPPHQAQDKVQPFRLAPPTAPASPPCLDPRGPALPEYLFPKQSLHIHISALLSDASSCRKPSRTFQPRLGPLCFVSKALKLHV